MPSEELTAARCAEACASSGWRQQVEAPTTACSGDAVGSSHLRVKGYQRLPELLSRAEAARLRALVLSHRPHLRWFQTTALPSVLTADEYFPVREVCQLLMRKDELRAALKAAFGSAPYSWAGQCRLTASK